MFRIALVDDEHWFLVGLRKLIEADPRFEVAFESTDSLAALQDICRQRPDAVLTDIRMPEMSGIELMQEVRSRHIETEFIVISGFAEFSYVQQALQAGALDYQLKPFDREMVGKMLDKLHDRLSYKQSVADMNTYAMLRDKSSDSAALLRRRFGGELMERLQVVLIEFADGQWKKDVFPDSSDCRVVSLQIGPQKCIYVVNSSRDLTDSLTDMLKQAETPLRAAFSRPGTAEQSFRLMLKEAEATMMDAFVQPEEKIFLWRKPQRIYIGKLADQVEQSLSNGDRKHARTLLQEVSGTFAEGKLSAADALQLWNCGAVYMAKTDPSNSLGLEQLDIYELTERFGDVQEMMQYLDSVQQAQAEDDASGASGKFFELIRYIDTHYAQTLYLRELCTEFYINMSYCCVLFKRNKNMTFSQYLTDVRITKACSLLQKDMPVAEVCRSVGYNDYFYFNKVFKKKMGETPAEYRRSQMKKGGDAL